MIGLKKQQKNSGDSDVWVVIGISGFYLGAKTAIFCLTNNFVNQLSKEERKAPKVILFLRIMFVLLGKTGFEGRKAELEKRL